MLKIDLEEIRKLLDDFENEVVLRKTSEGMPNIYILVKGFSEHDYKIFQNKLFEIIPEKYINEIYVTEFYRQFTIFLERVVFEFVGLNDKDVNSFARMPIV